MTSETFDSISHHDMNWRLPLIPACMSVMTQSS